jgi:hypothetical protein
VSGDAAGGNMEKMFAVVDGQLYINEAYLTDSTAGMIRISDERVAVLAQAVSSFSVQLNSECAARATAEASLAARIDSIQAHIKPDA